MKRLLVVLLKSAIVVAAPLMLMTAAPSFATAYTEGRDEARNALGGAAAVLGAGAKVSIDVGEAGAEASRGDADGYQAFGWIDHGEYGVDPSGVQIAFGVVELGENSQRATKGVLAVGSIWNMPAGQDVSFEVPPGLAAPLALAADELEQAGLDRMQTARLPATFTDRATKWAALGGTTYPGSITFLAEGAGDYFGLSVIDKVFVSEAAGWTVRYLSAGSDVSRLADLSVSLDCPDLGIFQLVVADWDNDHVELFRGTPLSIEVSK